MFNKILVGIDRSLISKKVFEVALSFATATGANLMLVQVLSDREEDYPQLPAYSYYPMWDDQTVRIYQQQWEEYKKQGIEILNNLAQQATEAGIATEFTQMSGSPERSICQIAYTWNADLIIVGNRGLTGIKEMVLGSVSNYVTHHAPCSVLIVRDTELLPPQSTSE
ncbi:UspA domain-containing protein [Stanieria cyanosphaera PCC 7437]|uniref:UspA domain-containing protein n=1 Tax=Stanieria cyanosphaera (strain ATCC 29371 / PCC 7437) TaxID=111780 RepID=K9XWQ1_STAC7|nr:universal stress protein [Stanieria cyanosphaera]AFZ36963.1 UspA domain-containing protein [Stanieria cyanosphaera PCC 7437]